MDEEFVICNWLMVARGLNRGIGSGGGIFFYQEYFCKQVIVALVKMELGGQSRKIMYFCRPLYYILGGRLPGKICFGCLQKSFFLSSGRSCLVPCVRIYMRTLRGFLSRSLPSSFVQHL